MFKMLELRGAGVVNVRWVPTDGNFADLFTKILGRQPLEKQLRTVLNLDANEAVEKARAARSKARDLILQRWSGSGSSSSTLDEDDALLHSTGS